ncbi:hypothetical protein BDQ17DRAFT_1427525 [Cyathus striatus]|nr:hypothetical protein BDQ17DRAFT_1427525 [Cyathus striatus]
MNTATRCATCYSTPIGLSSNRISNCSSCQCTRLCAQVFPAPWFTPDCCFTPPQQSQQEYNQNYQTLNTSYDNYAAYQGGEVSVEGLTEQMEELETSQYYDDSFGQYPVEYDHSGVDGSYYGHTPVFMRQPLNYHLYTPAIPPEFLNTDTDTHFVPNSTDLRQRLQSQSETIRSTAPLGLNLPEELQGYHTLVPLEPTAVDAERRKIGGNWYSTVYRAIRTSDGVPYALRRVENYRLMHQAAFAPIEAWSHIRHPAIIPIRESFTTRSFDDNSLVVSYTYYPEAKTLYEAHLKVTKPASFQPHSRSQLQITPQRIDERTLWTYIVQIASAIKKVHDNRLALRMIDASKILLTGKNRVRLSCAGLLDILFYDTPSDMMMLQQEDLTMFGRLIFALCCGNPVASSASHFQKSLDLMSKAYSSDVKSAALFLISKGGLIGIDQLMDMIRGRVLAEHDEALMATDILENELRGELENARLVRLLCKVGFINERPEFALDPRWSETGDRYIIKLFRDYVFHQVDEHGNPVVNLTHVLTCLNKLDAGTEERIMLVARDEQSCLVVSYKDIKACIEGAFSELATKGKPSSALLHSYRR